MATALETGLSEVLDSEWVRSLFYTPNDANSEAIYRSDTLRYQTTANTSIGGSGIGNSRVLNPPPGINQFADIPRGFGGDGTGVGNGVYHHEMLEKPMDIVHIRPGIPRYNPLTTFWTNAFNSETIETIEYGWIRKTAGFVGKVLGLVITAPLMVAGYTWKALRSLALGPNANKYNFYYLSPAPMLFWKGLDDMMNTVAIKLGFTGDARSSDGKVKDDGTLDSTVNQDMASIMDIMPGMFSELDMTGGYRIDTISLAHRYNMMYNMRTKYLKDKSKELFGKTFTTDRDYYNAMAQWEAELMVNPSVYRNGKSVNTMLDEAKNVLKGLNSYQNSGDRYSAIMGSNNWSGDPQTKKTNQGKTIITDGIVKATEVEDPQETIEYSPPMDGLEFGEGTQYSKKYRSIAEGGLDFFSLAVDKVDSGSISISNSVGASNIESLFNGGVATAKNTWFSINNGNVGDGVISDSIESVVGTGKALVNNMLNSVTGGIQSALFGGKAYIDIPDVYQNSSVTLPSTKFSFTSQAISGHPISKLKMLLPILAIMRCASPISAGPRSFMSPYLVNIIQKGRNIVPMGLITNMSLDWGGEAGWDVNDIPCEVKCEFEVSSLDKNFHVPLSNDLTDIYNDDGTYDAFTNIITGVSPLDLDRSWAYSIKTRWARAVSNTDRFFSTSHLALSTGIATRAVFEGPISVMGGYINRDY